jgi:SNARE protein 1
VPADALAGYKRRTEALAASLRPAARPPYLRAPVSRPVAAPSLASAAAAASSAAAAGGFRGAQPQPEASTSALRRRAAVPSAETAAVLRRHAALQEDLTDELVDMAAGLKRNALAMDAGLRESMRVLDAVEARAACRRAGAA